MIPPPLPQPVPGVHHLVMDVGDAEGIPSNRDYFRFQLWEFTAATMLGNDKKRWDAAALHNENLHDPLTRIPLGNLARWLCHEPQEYWRDPGVKETTRAMADEIVRLLREEPLNEQMREAFQTEWIDAVIPGDGYSSDVPVVLFLDARLLGREFIRWYGQKLVAAEQAQTDQMCKGLRLTLGAAVRDANAAYEERRKIRDKMAPHLEKLQGGLLVIDICLDFAKPKSERVKMWPDWEHAGERYVDPPPDRKWLERAQVFRNEWHDELIGRCANVASKATQHKIDAAADAIVDQLRAPGAPYLQMLSNWDDLSPGARAELMFTVREAVTLALRSDSSRERLLSGELASVARVAVSDHAIPSAVEDAEVRSLLDSFDLTVLREPKSTPFGEKLVEWHGTMSDAKSHADVVFMVLGLGTPFILKDIKDRSSAPKGIGWAIHAALGTTRLPRAAWAKVWTDLKALWSARGRGAYEVLHADRNLFDAHKGALAWANKHSASAFDFVATVMKIVAVQKTADDLAAEPGSFEKKLEHAKALTDYLAATFNAVADDDAWKCLCKTFETRAGKITTPTIPKAIGIIADGLSFMISVEKYMQLVRTRRQGAAVDAAKFDVYFDALTFAVTVVGAITGLELLVAGLAIYLVKLAVTDFDAWVPLVPWTLVEAKPAPHSFLEGLLEQLLAEESGFEKTCLELGAHGGQDCVDEARSVYDDLSVAPMATTQLLWDLGGAHWEKPFSVNLPLFASKFIHQRWSFPTDVVEKIVRPCRHG